ncbi:helix-turn-helix transcriptional regulator [Burkholderia cepacia]|uniref:helix-turn-helix transcriptional regulator n=1 Tax=Burkholderia cepacia TaxID=292 RepID=UPI00265316BC|nr:helix-turn-helix domain-containing protein [Burkholderia cepacia]MDN7614068.1 helix-turn-helix domain-containing protein [Burkholderia cepacia]
MPYVSKSSKVRVVTLSGCDVVLSEDLLDLLADRIAGRVAAQLRERAPVPATHPQGLTTASASLAPTLRPDRLYRVRAVALQLDVCVATVYRLIREGRLELVKIGARASGVTGKSLIALIERNCGRLD